MINPVKGVNYQYTPISRPANTQAAQTIQKTSQDFENLLNAIVYQQNGLTTKLVRIVGEMYQGQKLDILA
ncbi:hypothetical protein [Marinitoga litoralis]|jgi:hypothetical protein|uniref:hypothetical protein n=1 Tax=Marinitoga litoralis TaxID=570855 RepID=UPI0019619461|nr:hypothetical protein [Marinitoga litoralis]MBM7558644.1 hypothetical protein [Marinitoga litoralis]